MKKWNDWVSREEFPRLFAPSLAGSPDEVMQKEIEYYEGKLLPFLESTGVSDLSGEVILFSVLKNVTNRPTTQKYDSVEQALNSFMN